MARNHLAPVTPVPLGATVTPVAATDTTGDAIRPGWVLWLRNAGGVSRTVTIITGGVENYGLAVADSSAITIGAGVDLMIGPFLEDFWPQTTNDAEFGWIWVNYDAITSLSRIALVI